MVDAFRVEESGELREDVRRGDAQRHHGHGNGGSDGVRANDVGRRKNRKVRAVSRENNAVDWEESHTALGGSGNMATIYSKHMRGEVGREIVDDHLEFSGENIRGGLRFDACKNLKHTKGVDERLDPSSDRCTYSGPRH